MVGEAGLSASRSNWAALCHEIFGPCGTPHERSKHVRLVGQLADALCGRPRPGAAEPASTDGEEESAGSRSERTGIAFAIDCTDPPTAVWSQATS